MEVLAPEGQVLNRGSTVAAAAGITVVAQSLVKQDVESSTYTNGGTVKCGLFGCNGSKTQSTITQRATMVSDTGGISITVKNGDYVQRGSSLEALNGTIAITAKNVSFETAAFEELNQSWNTSMSLTGVSSSTTKSNNWTVERPTVFANAIDIRASSNVTGTGAQIAAADSLTIKAGGDIDFKALWTSPGLAESRCLLFFVGVERRFEGGGADVAQARMPPARVIEAFDVLPNGVGSLPA